MKRREWLFIPFIFLGTFLLFSAPPADGAQFPSKPIRVILALGAGGSADLNARAVASVAHEVFGQPMIVQLMPGGGGKIGMSALKRSKPDGHTIALASPSHLLISPHVRNMGFDPLKDFIPVFQVTKADFMLVSPASKPWKNFKEFVEAARKRPGKVSFGSSGVYGYGHLLILKVMAGMGVKINHVPFKGGGPAFRAMLGGHVDSAAANAASATGGARGLIRKGKVNVLGVLAEKRSPVYPNAPTMKEQGLDFTLTARRFYVVPKGTPKDRINILAEGFKKLMKNKTYVRLLKKNGGSARAPLEPRPFERDSG